MNDNPRETLRRIVAKHGKEIAGNAERCRGLLNDLCGAYRREINILVTAVEERVPLDLLAAARSMPTNLLLARLEKRLADQTGLTAEAARWAVETWALALDLATDSQIAGRQLKPNNNLAGEAAAKKQSAIDENRSISQNAPEIEPRGEKQPPKKQTFPSPAKQPPIAMPPANTPPPSYPPTSSPANNRPPIQAGGTSYLPAPRTRFWLFRGCLLFVLLLIVSFGVLLFGVPFAIEKMRETQREKPNEPPRFPAR